METARIPGASSLIPLLAARMAQKSGQTETSIVFLKTMYAKAKDKNTKRLLENRIKAHTGILVLEKAIKVFRNKYGFRPNSLEDLISKGVLSKLPKNPYDIHYYYNPKTQEISFTRF